MIAKSIAALLLIMAFLGGCVAVDCEEERRGGVSHRIAMRPGLLISGVMIVELVVVNGIDEKQGRGPGRGPGQLDQARDSPAPLEESPITEFLVLF